MSELPKDLRYTKDHEWARVDGDAIVIGITAHAVEQLGDITAVSLPDVGEAVEAGERFGDIDSVKAVSDLYSPIDGTVARINEALDDEPEKINDDPYGEGWMIAITPAAGAGLDELLDASAYQQLIDEG